MKNLNKKEEKIFLSDPLISYQEKINYCNIKANYYFDKSDKLFKLSIFFGIIALLGKCISLIIKIMN